MARPTKAAGERKATGKATKVTKAKKPAGAKGTKSGVKRPPSAYILFSQDERAKTNLKLTIQEIAGRWKTIDPAEKAVYEAKAKEAKDNFSSKPAEKKIQKKVEEAIPNGDDLSGEEEMDEEEESDDEN